ncbi:hypothetical protein Riv7116_5751 [Rivularia sp. PCC 7116]|uniref:hypothetical protein n=1 Tax=Rivularia sp. PCC 7116 TaxID=373994 RepID=UPI00029EDC79|nr:hypothetical protein [Rivularia sp. PCC 7116]AFY58117.1 hypothetical protein Riv7116_5751 [Rivularia sp. PCC 7116]
MKIIYTVLSLLILVASPSFIQNSIFQTPKNQLNIRQEAKTRSPKPRKNHRGSGRLYINTRIDS